MSAVAQPGPAGHRDLIDALAAYAAGVRLQHMPEGARRQARLCILDTIGAIVAGSRTDDYRPLLEVESREHPAPEAAVVGAGRRLSVQAAARVNAYMGDIFELNDLIGGHASIGNVSALVALAESLGAGGARLVEAVAIGIEVTARVYAGYYPAIKPFTEVGMNPVGFPASLGVAAGAAHLLGLSREQAAHAIGIGAALAGWCPSEVIFGDGGSVKPMLFGACPATAGLAGARYAQAGMTGPHLLLEGSRGYFNTAARRSFPEAVLDRDIWYLQQPRRKLHACCGYIHGPIDTVVQMRRAGVPVADAAAIRIGMTALTIPAVSKPGPPVSATDARFHLQYCVALAALGEDVIAPEHSMDFAAHMTRPEIASLVPRIRVVDDPALTHYHQCTVALLDATGAVVEKRTGTVPKGAPGNPMSDDEVRAKFRRLAAARMPADDIDAYIGRIERLESDDDLRWVAGSFG
ncbi:MAG: MmgE/PrpD family protein [Gammaproteobacteria bacterium]